MALGHTRPTGRPFRTEEQHVSDFTELVALLGRLYPEPTPPPADTELASDSWTFWHGLRQAVAR